MASFIIYIIRWAVSLTLLYSLYGLFMKRETLHGFNRVVLLAVLVGSMVLPLCQIEVKESNYVMRGRELLEQQILLEQRVVEKNGDYWATDAEKEYAEGVSRIMHTPLNTDMKPLKVKGWTWFHTLLLFIEVYLMGLIIYWARYFWQMASLLIMIHRSKKVKVEGLPAYVHVVTHSGVKAPCSWMRWIILNPDDIGTHAVIKHEQAHIQYGHSWDMLLCELTCRMLWFVPFAWMLRQDLRDVHEYQADRRVMRSGIDENEYQLLLIRKATSTGLQPVVNAFNQSPIKRRFTMMYRKPSRRWVALKAAYLLPLCALALLAFARPQAISDIEKTVEVTAPAITQAAKALAQQLPSLQEEGQEVEAETLPATEDITVPTPDPIPTWEGSGSAELPDSNLVKADLAGQTEEELHAKGVAVYREINELMDSVMLAIGARKLYEGCYYGHFQPNLDSDTVRIRLVKVLDRQSKVTMASGISTVSANDPYAYELTLQAETRKERTGYYIRFLQPVNSTLRHYDRTEVDPKMLSTDSVLTKRRSRLLMPHTPIAMSQTKKEARIFMYVWFGKNAEVDALMKQKYNFFHDLTIVDEATGDKYVCRSIDYSYFKYVKDETVRNDTVRVYQVCLVFPPFGKHVDEVYFDRINSEYVSYDTFFSLNGLPRKGRVITN